MARTFVDLTEQVTWPSWASGAVLLGAGAAQPTTVAPGASGNVLTSNGSVWASQAPTGGGGATVDPVTISAAATLTLAVSSTTAVQDYVYNGSGATTWTLPAVSGNTGKRLILENAGTTAAATITLNRAGTDSIWFLSALTSIPIARGGSLVMVCDGTYWQVLSTDLANDSVGILPLANGGTGQTGGDTHTVTSAGTTTLTIASTQTQTATGTATHTYVLPTTSVLAGMQWQVINQSTGAVTVQASGGATVWGVAANTSAVFTANAAAPTTAAGWDLQYGGVSVTSGKVMVVSNSLTFAGTDGTTQTFPAVSGSVFSSASAIPNANIPNGINNANSALQSQVTVAATNYYVAGSGLVLPNPLKAGMVVGTIFRWRVWMAKTAAGTGAFNIVIYRGTLGTTGDTADVTQSIGTQTAVVDDMVLDVQLTVTATGASGSYYWTICPMNKAATATGFGCAVGSLQSGTKTAVALNTAGLIFGLGFASVTGTPTITVPLVQAQAFNVD